MALVIGANDVTNPAACQDKSSPIYGMPIIDVDKARTVMVIKRGLNPGFAGIENGSCSIDKTLMLFGDAKWFVGEMVKELNSRINPYEELVYKDHRMYNFHQIRRRGKSHDGGADILSAQI